MILINSPMSPPAVAGTSDDSTRSLATTWPSSPRATTDGFLHAQAMLGLELLDGAQRLVGTAVVLEGDGDHVVAVESVRGHVV